MQKLFKLITMLFVTYSLSVVKEEEKEITSIHETWDNVASFLDSPLCTLCKDLNIPPTLASLPSNLWFKVLSFLDLPGDLPKEDPCTFFARVALNVMLAAEKRKSPEFFLKTLPALGIVNAIVAPEAHPELPKIAEIVAPHQLSKLFCQAIRIHLNNLRRDGTSDIGFVKTDTAAFYPIKSSDTGELLGVNLWLDPSHPLYPIAKKDKSFRLTQSRKYLATEVFFAETNRPDILAKLNQPKKMDGTFPRLTDEEAANKFTIISTWYLGYQKFQVYDDLAKFYKDKRSINMQVLVVNTNPQINDSSVPHV